MKVFLTTSLAVTKKKTKTAVKVLRRQGTTGLSRTNLYFAGQLRGQASPVPPAGTDAGGAARSRSRLCFGRHSRLQPRLSRLHLPAPGPPGSGHLRTPEATRGRPRAGSTLADGALRMLPEPRAAGRPRRHRRPSPAAEGRRLPAPGRGRCAPAPARPSTHRGRGAAGGGRARPAAPAPRLR